MNELRQAEPGLPRNKGRPVMTAVSLAAAPSILDLGCGTSKEPGAFGIDNAELPGVDLVHDLMDFPYPFEEASVKEVYLKHVLEHFPLEDLQRILAEVYRILEPGGVCHVR